MFLKETFRYYLNPTFIFFMNVGFLKHQLLHLSLLILRNFTHSDFIILENLIKVYSG